MNITRRFLHFIFVIVFLVMNSFAPVSFASNDKEGQTQGVFSKYFSDSSSDTKSKSEDYSNSDTHPKMEKGESKPGFFARLFSSEEEVKPIDIAAKYGKDDVPLIVLRFTHSNIIYEKTLYDYVSKALKVKPNTHFDVVSVAKESSDESIQEQYNQMAARNADKVMNSLHEIGIPDDRLAFGKKIEKIKYSEVRIYIHD